MKNKLKLIVVICLFSNILLGQEPFHATRMMTSDDPNTDPNWKWYENVMVQLYIQSNTPPTNRLMPWFDNNGTAAVALNTGSNSTRDMYPSDGWVLVYRDFGTSSIEQIWPHFILYNKFKGILRLFFIDFNLATEKTLYAVKFYHKNNSITSANISSDLTNKGYLDLYDPEHTQIAICRAAPGQWAYVDFDLTTYDPNLPDYLAFGFEVNSILQGNVNLFANKLDEVQDNNPTVFDGVNSTIKKAEGAIALGKSYFSTPKGFLDDMKKLADNNKGKWFENALLTIAGSTIANSIPVIGGVVGILSGFFGNDKGVNSSFTPFTITGDIKFEKPVAYFFIWTPGSKRSESEGRGIPLYNKPLGIIGMKQPQILVYPEVHVFMIDQLNFIINPFSDLKITYLNFGFVKDNESVQYYSEQPFFKTNFGSGQNGSLLPYYSIAMEAGISSVCNPSFKTFLVKNYKNPMIKIKDPFEFIHNEENVSIINQTITFESMFNQAWPIGATFYIEDCTGIFTAPTSIVLKSGTTIKGGDILITTRYKGAFQSYLTNPFICSEQQLSPSYSKNNVTVDEIAVNQKTSEVSDISKQNIFKVYPNPFINSIYINPNNYTNDFTVRIYSINGSLMFKKICKNNTLIETSFLNSGIYVLEISDLEGKKTREKIIKY